MRPEARHYAVFALLSGALAGGAALWAHFGVAVSAPDVPTVSVHPVNAPAGDGEVLGAADDSNDEPAAPVALTPTKLGWPLTDATSRVTKKPFGKYVTPETSPVPNDKFTGFHVGVDFETTEEEAEADVPVFAICDGPLIWATWANGYGGVATQSCAIDDEDVTVIYGHINVDTVTVKAGQRLTTGDRVALLGRGGTKEVDGVRKHLHLGIRRNDDKQSIRGYVKTEEEIAQFIDGLGVIAE